MGKNESIGRMVNMKQIIIEIDTVSNGYIVSLDKGFGAARYAFETKESLLEALCIRIRNEVGSLKEPSSED